MPYENIINNREVIMAAARKTRWKKDIAYSLSRKEGKDDTRNFLDLAPLLIDLNGIPEDEQEAYYTREVQKMADAFNTKGPIPGKPDPEAIRPYIAQMFEKIVTDPNIDWSNQRQVEAFFSTVRITQALATVVNNFFTTCLDLYPTNEKMAKLDAHTSKAYMLYLKLAPQLARAGMGLEIDQCIQLGIYGSDSPYFDALGILGSGVCDAVLNDEDTVLIDPTQNEIMKKHLLGEEFEIEQAGGICSSTDYEEHFLEAISGYSTTTSLEQVVYKAINDNTTTAEFSAYSYLMINGKSVTDIMNDMAKKEGLLEPNYKVRHAVQRKVRDALTDGKSVVTLMSVSYNKDGAVKFSHKELKMDLDKLNEADRKETNYSRFRRFLDRIGLWKIKRFATNAERDAKQEKIKEGSAYKDAIKAAENKFIDQYNSIDKSQRGIEDTFSIIPQLKRAEEITEKQIETQITANNTEREPINDINLGKEETKVEVEPKKDDNVKVIQTDAVKK